MPDFDIAKEYCIYKLKNEISPQLTYHNYFHTIEEVIPAVDRLASIEKVGDEERLLLLTAAYYHDLGYTRQRQGHEAISIQLAEESLPGFGYTTAQLEVIRGIIQATCIPQAPTTLLECIMADADLDYLGVENFWQRSADLRQELENFGPRFTDREWYTYQLRFIEAHHFFTESAQALRASLKNTHLMEIRARLSQTEVLAIK